MVFYKHNELNITVTTNQRF